MQKVKILLATYNGEKYISEQITSILNQQEVLVEVDISDDGSVDKTLNIVNTEFPSIFTNINHPGTGSAAKNFLQMVAKLDLDQDFEFIAFSDQDDIWLPEKMISAIRLLSENNASLYCSNLTKWETNTDSYSLLKKDFPQRKFDYLFEGGSAGCTYVFTKGFAKNLQIFLQDLNTASWKGFSHDWLVYFFARANNYKVVIDGQSHIHYRLHETNVHGHLNKLSWATVKEKSAEVFKGYYQSHAVNYIKYLNKNSEAYYIYKKFLSGYFSRNFVIWRYNFQLMRDKKKFLIFALLNLLKFR